MRVTPLPFEEGVCDTSDMVLALHRQQTVGPSCSGRGLAPLVIAAPRVRKFCAKPAKEGLIVTDACIQVTLFVTRHEFKLIFFGTDMAN